MDTSYYEALSETGLTGRYRATPSTAGPWAATLQHGGPPNALAAAAAEHAVRAETGRADLVAVRLASDFIGPVPVGEVSTKARVLRAARSAALVEVVVSAAGRDCLLVRVWFVRSADTTDIAAGSAINGAAAAASPPPLPPAGPNTALGIEFGLGASLEWRFVHGALTGRGPAAAWVRPRIALTDSLVALSGLSRAVLIADSGNGISSELDWASWSFLNVDLDVHLARPLIGEWVLLDAATQLGPAGSALARSTLSDERGVVGSAAQTLILSRTT